MRSPTVALLWEIWRRNRIAVVAIVVMTLAGRLIDASERAGGSADTSSLVELLQMASFALLFGILNYTESTDGRGPGVFPRRTFTLPISTLRLVSVPALTGIICVELLYAAWFAPWSSRASASPWFVAVLFAASMVCYQAAFWTLDRLGSLRLVAGAAVAFSAFAVGLLPTFAPSPPPFWRSEPALTVMAATVAILVFLFEWRAIARKRSGGRRANGVAFPVATPRSRERRADRESRSPFRSATAAHFWYEWRCGGLALPALVAVVLIAVIAPLTWINRHDAAASFRFLLAALATPIVLAIPIGMAFARPTFWSDDMTMPAFVAVRPLTAEDIVAVKIKVAAASAGAAWLMVCGFVVAWLLLWGNADALSQLAVQWWAFYGQSAAAVYSGGALIVLAATLLTWRFLVIRLWTGMSGSFPLFTASVLSLLIAAIAWMVFDGTRLPDWVLADPAHMAVTVWLLAIAVAAKYWLAAYSWRRATTRYARPMLLLWAAGTLCFLTLLLLVANVVRIYVALDVYRFQSLMILVALLAMPLGRLGLVPAHLAGNRHR